MGKTEVVIERQPWNFSCKVYARREYNGKYFNLTSDKDGILTETEVPLNSQMPAPLLVVPEDILQQIIEAFSEIMPPVKKEKVEAELIATKYHLEDMRKIVFQDKELKGGE